MPHMSTIDRWRKARRRSIKVNKVRHCANPSSSQISFVIKDTFCQIQKGQQAKNCNTDIYFEHVANVKTTADSYSQVIDDCFEEEFTWIKQFVRGARKFLNQSEHYLPSCYVKKQDESAESIQKVSGNNCIAEVKNSQSVDVVISQNHSDNASESNVKCHPAEALDQHLSKADPTLNCLSHFEFSSLKTFGSGCTDVPLLDNQQKSDPLGKRKFNVGESCDETELYGKRRSLGLTSMNNDSRFTVENENISTSSATDVLAVDNLIKLSNIPAVRDKHFNGQCCDETDQVLQNTQTLNTLEVLEASYKDLGNIHVNTVCGLNIDSAYNNADCSDDYRLRSNSIDNPVNFTRSDHTEDISEAIKISPDTGSKLIIVTKLKPSIVTVNKTKISAMCCVSVQRASNTSVDTVSDVSECSGLSNNVSVGTDKSVDHEEINRNSLDVQIEVDSDRCSDASQVKMMLSEIISLDRPMEENLCVGNISCRIIDDKTLSAPKSFNSMLTSQMKPHPISEEKFTSQCRMIIKEPSCSSEVKSACKGTYIDHKNSIKCAVEISKQCDDYQEGQSNNYAVDFPQGPNNKISAYPNSATVSEINTSQHDEFVMNSSSDECYAVPYSSANTSLVYDVLSKANMYEANTTIKPEISAQTPINTSICVSSVAEGMVVVSSHKSASHANVEQKNLCSMDVYGGMTCEEEEEKMRISATMAPRSGRALLGSIESGIDMSSPDPRKCSVTPNVSHGGVSFSKIVDGKCTTFASSSYMNIFNPVNEKSPALNNAVIHLATCSTNPPIMSSSRLFVRDNTQAHTGTAGCENASCSTGINTTNHNSLRPCSVIESDSGSNRFNSSGISSEFSGRIHLSDFNTNDQIVNPVPGSRLNSLAEALTPAADQFYDMKDASFDEILNNNEEDGERKERRLSRKRLSSCLSDEDQPTKVPVGRDSLATKQQKQKRMSNTQKCAAALVRKSLTHRPNVSNVSALNKQQSNPIPTANRKYQSQNTSRAGAVSKGSVVAAVVAAGQRKLQQQTVSMVSRSSSSSSSSLSTSVRPPVAKFRKSSTRIKSVHNPNGQRRSSRRSSGQSSVASSRRISSGRPPLPPRNHIPQSKLPAFLKSEKKPFLAGGRPVKPPPPPPLYGSGVTPRTTSSELSKRGSGCRVSTASSRGGAVRNTPLKASNVSESIDVTPVAKSSVTASFRSRVQKLQKILTPKSVESSPARVVPSTPDTERKPVLKRWKGEEFISKTPSGKALSPKKLPATLVQCFTSPRRSSAVQQQSAQKSKVKKIALLSAFQKSSLGNNNVGEKSSKKTGQDVRLLQQSSTLSVQSGSSSRPVVESAVNQTYEANHTSSVSLAPPSIQILSETPVKRGLFKKLQDKVRPASKRQQALKWMDGFNQPVDQLPRAHTQINLLYVMSPTSGRDLDADDENDDDEDIDKTPVPQKSLCHINIDPTVILHPVIPNLNVEQGEFSQKSGSHEKAGECSATASAVKKPALRTSISMPCFKTKYENYNIHNIHSDDSTDDESRPKRVVPDWAQGSQLMATLIDFYYHPIDTLELFGEISAPDLNEMFDQKKPRFDKRTSSANWEQPLYNSLMDLSQFLPPRI